MKITKQIAIDKRYLDSPKLKRKLYKEAKNRAFDWLINSIREDKSIRKQVMDKCLVVEETDDYIERDNDEDAPLPVKKITYTLNLKEKESNND